jgi:hypothetical protein
MIYKVAGGMAYPYDPAKMGWVRRALTQKDE